LLLKSSLRKAAIAWIVANQLGRRHLTPSQKGPLGMELEKQLAEAAKLRRRATQNNNAGKAVVAKLPEVSELRILSITISEYIVASYAAPTQAVIILAFRAANRSTNSWRFAASDTACLIRCRGRNQ